MECCQCQGIETTFDQEYVAKKLKRYREKGPKKSTQILIDALQDALGHDVTLLDIGGGIGDVQLALLRAGIQESVNCEASSAFINACKEEADRQGFTNRITHIRGDFVEVAESVSSADIVTLDRVICCYHDMPTLVDKSLAKARRLYGVVIPIDKWWVKVASSIYYNLRFLIFRNPFRVFIHPTKAVEALIFNKGFRSIFSQVKGAWQISVYERHDGS